MALEMIITPTLEDSANGRVTTNLRITVNLNTIKEGLKKYDLLLKTRLEVKTEESNIYECCEIYRNIVKDTINFDLFVLGDLKNTSNIIAKAEAVFVKKLEREWQNGNDRLSVHK